MLNRRNSPHDGISLWFPIAITILLLIILLLWWLDHTHFTIMGGFGFPRSVP
jgi:hypothetical protein